MPSLRSVAQKVVFELQSGSARPCCAAGRYSRSRRLEQSLIALLHPPYDPHIGLRERADLEQSGRFARHSSASDALVPTTASSAPCDELLVRARKRIELHDLSPTCAMLGPPAICRLRVGEQRIRCTSARRRSCHAGRWAWCDRSDRPRAPGRRATDSATGCAEARSRRHPAGATQRRDGHVVLARRNTRHGVAQRRTTSWRIFNPLDLTQADQELVVVADHAASRRILERRHVVLRRNDHEATLTDLIEGRCAEAGECCDERRQRDEGPSRLMATIDLASRCFVDMPRTGAHGAAHGPRRSSRLDGAIIGPHRASGLLAIAPGLRRNRSRPVHFRTVSPPPFPSVK